MTETELYSTRVRIEGEEVDLEALYDFLSSDERYGDSISGAGDSINMRTHGLEIEFHEDYFEAEISPYARKDSEALGIAMLLKEKYKADTSALLGTGFSGGG